MGTGQSLSVGSGQGALQVSKNKSVVSPYGGHDSFMGRARDISPSPPKGAEQNPNTAWECRRGQACHLIIWMLYIARSTMDFLLSAMPTSCPEWLTPRGGREGGLVRRYFDQLIPFRCRMMPAWPGDGPPTKPQSRYRFDIKP
jgi:hypothetical protein